MTPRPLTIALAGVTIVVEPEAVPAVESALRAYTRSRRPRRDLAAEVERFLADHPGVSVVEIARAIRARDYDVRRVLNSDARFRALSAAPGRSTRVRAWVLAETPSDAVPSLGTGGDRGRAR